MKKNIDSKTPQIISNVSMGTNTQLAKDQAGESVMSNEVKRVSETQKVAKKMLNLGLDTNSDNIGKNYPGGGGASLSKKFVPHQAEDLLVFKKSRDLFTRTLEVLKDFPKKADHTIKDSIYQMLIVFLFMICKLEWSEEIIKIGRRQILFVYKL